MTRPFTSVQIDEEAAMRSRCWSAISSLSGEGLLKIESALQNASKSEKTAFVTSIEVYAG